MRIELSSNDLNIILSWAQTEEHYEGGLLACEKDLYDRLEKVLD